jgi:plastocyanin
MKKIILWIIIIIAIALVGGFIYLKSKPGATVSANCTESTAASTVITYTAGREFTPSCIKIASGSTIVWKNESNRTLEIGADPHPIHTGNKEVSGGDFVLKVEPNTTQTVVMNKIGTFGYHDHEHASATGVIQVK